MSSAPDKAKDIFLIAVEQYAPDQWPSYLDQACRDDPELRHRVELLLEAHAGAESILDSPAITPPATLDQPITEKPGTQIGPYKLLQQIGEGGMGVVYMAEQKEPVKRRVALKIIKPGMDTRQVIARFEAERQALAMMDHPNIAKVLDAGATESGRPYFVMELVNGLPVTKYCDEQHLTPKERLELFVPICQAVQHAHQKGIIHRDLKPSNILVALYDSQPVPKIIDFGVAKATSQALTEKTMFTQLGQVVGTLEYMSPEQAERNQLDIDTRSDIYSLGVVLYELLTGDTPHDRTRLRSAAFDEMLRIIREEEPPRPSTKLSGSETLPSVAANRHTEPQKLSALVRGELDWIVMKALEKDRARRYGTASKLAEDVQHYLNDEPVVACPPSAMYRVRKLIRRNRALLSTVALIAAALMIGTVLSIWQAVRATHAVVRAQQSEAVAEENLQTALDAVKQLLDNVGRDELANTPYLQPLRESLLQKALQFYKTLAERSSSKAAPARFYGALAYLGMGEIQAELGKHAEAAEAYQRAMDMLQSLAEEAPSEGENYLQARADAFRLAGVLDAAIGNHDLAQQKLAESLRLLNELGRHAPLDPKSRLSQAEALTQMGILYKKQGRLDQAEKVQQEGLKVISGLVEQFENEPEYRFAFAKKLGDLSNVLEAMQRYDEATVAGRKAANTVRRLSAEFPESRKYRRASAMIDRNIGLALWRSGAEQDALRQLEQAAARQTKLTQEFPSLESYKSDLAGTLNMIGVVLAGSQQHDAAIEYYRQARQTLQDLVDRFPTVPVYKNEYAGVIQNLGLSVRENGDLDEACRLFQEAMDHQRQAIKLEKENARYRRFLFNHMYNLALVRAQQGKPEEATDAVNELQREFGTLREFAAEIVELLEIVGDALAAAGFEIQARNLRSRANRIRQASAEEATEENSIPEDRTSESSQAPQQ